MKKSDVEIIAEIIDHCAYYLKKPDEVALRPALILFDLATLFGDKFPEYKDKINALACDLSQNHIFI